jgi:hypothetical protein
LEPEKWMTGKTNKWAGRGNDIRKDFRIAGRRQPVLARKKSYLGLVRLGSIGGAAAPGVRLTWA